MQFDNPQIKVIGIVFQNIHGNKYYSRYYDNPNATTSDFDLSKQENQRQFEQGIRNKVQRMNIMSVIKPEQTEIFTYENYTVLFKLIDELQIYLIVPEDENFILMEEVINVVGTVLQMITKGPYTGKIIFDILQDIVIIADEIIHDGYIVCLDSAKIFDRARMKDQGANSPTRVQPQAQSSTQQSAVSGTFSSLFGFAKTTFNKTLNLG